MNNIEPSIGQTTGNIALYPRNTSLSFIHIFVDDVRLLGFDTGYIPIVIPISAGGHTLRLSCEGNKDWIKQIEIGADQTTKVYAFMEEGSGTSVTRNETITPTTSYGLLNLSVYGRSYQIEYFAFIDDEPFNSNEYQTWNLDFMKIPIGTHSLRLSCDGYKDWIKQIEIDADQTTIVFAGMEEGSGTSETRNETISPTTSYGLLNLTVYDPLHKTVQNVDVFIDNEFLYSKTMGIPAGIHSLRLSNDGFKEWVKQIEIGADQITKVFATMEEGSGTSVTRNETISYVSAASYGSLDVRIDTQVLGVKLYLDNEFCAEIDGWGNPNKIDGVLEGTYTVKLTKTDYNDWTNEITVVANQQTPVVSTLSLIGGSEPPSDGSDTPWYSGIVDYFGFTNLVILVVVILASISVISVFIFIRKRKKKKALRELYRTSKQKIPEMKYTDYVFISHIEEDADVALEIAKGLDEAGYHTWFYERDSVPGVSYLLTIGKAIERSKVIIVLVSPASLGSNQVTSEIIRAHEARKHFIPILRDITHIKFQQRQPEWRAAFGSATSISIQKKDVSELIPRVIAGLKQLGIQPEQPN